MDYKYHDFINEMGLSDCPPSSYHPCNEKTSLYNWCHYPISDARNYVPVGVEQPSRIRKKDLSTSEICEYLALSVYPTEDDAIEWYRQRITNKKLIEKVGDHISTGILGPTEGVISNPDSTQCGHMNLHELSGVDLRTKFNIVKKIE